MHKVEIHLKSHLSDARGLSLVRDICDLGITAVLDIRVVDIYWLDADLTPEELDLICRLLADPVTQDYRCEPSPSDESEIGNGHFTIEVAYNAGVDDPVEDTIMKAVQDLGVEDVSGVKTAKRYLIQGQLDTRQLETICNRLLVNPIIQHIVKPEHPIFSQNPQYGFMLNQIDILGGAGLTEVRERFDFTGDELQAIITYFLGQGRKPTDAELETLSQTWSEHCVHKTFKSKISFAGQPLITCSRVPS